MSISQTARKIRCSDVLRHFMSRGCRNTFLTLTTKDVVTLFEIRERWRNLRHDLIRRLGDGAQYVMNYELHPKGHGWHIHAVFNRPVPLRHGGLANIQRFGFGRVGVELVDSIGVSEYLSKHCLKAYRGVRSSLRSGCKRLRLVNTSRGLPRLSDYHWASDHLSKMRNRLSLVSKISHPLLSSLSFPRLYSAVELSVLMGWSLCRLERLVRDRSLSGRLASFS